MPASHPIARAPSQGPSGAHATLHSRAFDSGSTTYRYAIRRLRRFAEAGNAAVLIEGESGTGKTVLARQFHKWSRRRDGPFHTVMLSAVDDGIAASELFGHEVGAYTDAKYRRKGCFASAEHGTLFLDEIGKASKVLQQMLLHAIETGEFRSVGSDTTVTVDLRVVAATNVPLEELLEKHGFLPDLRSRLAYFRVRLPPLRERRADIPGLVHEMLANHAAEYGYDDPPAVDPPLLAAMRQAPWPDNLRQLDAMVQRLLIEADGAATISLAHCDDDLEFLVEIARDQASKQPGRLTRQRLADVMARVKNNKSEAARVLGVDRTTVHRTLKRFEGRRAEPSNSGSAGPRGVAPHDERASVHRGATPEVRAR